ncbi:MAG TPA: hypothetical protein VD887_05160 [Allosphingosinicella sp.]|nr:hypothetical protein [Allosphingosinicella sp.]
MKKFLLGTAAAAVAIGTAPPASAQYYDRYDRRDGIDASDIVTGIAVVGGIAAILSAFDRDGGRYGYDNRYRYRDNYSAAVNSCGQQAQRYTRGGQVRITDVDRRSNGRYEVEGVVESGYGGYDRRFGSRDYGERFTCVAYGNGRIAQFRMRDGYASRSRW